MSDEATDDEVRAAFWRHICPDITDAEVGTLLPLWAEFMDSEDAIISFALRVYRTGMGAGYAVALGQTVADSIERARAVDTPPAEEVVELVRRIDAVVLSSRTVWAGMAVDWTSALIAYGIDRSGVYETRKPIPAATPVTAGPLPSGFTAPEVKVSGALCDRAGCPAPQHDNHWHCARCASPEITGMMGHGDACPPDLLQRLADSLHRSIDASDGAQLSTEPPTIMERYPDGTREIDRG